MGDDSRQTFRSMTEASRGPENGLPKDAGIARLAAIVESSADAIISHQPNGIIESWNGGAEALLGYSSGEMLGRSIALLIPPEGLRQEEGMLEKARGGEPATCSETLRVHKDGHSVVVSVVLSLSGTATTEIVAISQIARPVTSRAKDEHAAAQLNAIIGSSTDAVISKTLDGVIQTWNSGAEQLYGYTADEVVGQPMMDLLPKSLIEEEQKLLETLRSGQRIDHFETVRIHKEGRPIPVSISLSPIRNSEGQLVGISHISRDISEAMHLKDRLQLSQRMEAVGRLAGGIAHDFNNLLTIITGYNALLQAALEDQPREKAMADEVMGAADKAAELTKQLLAFSRGQAVRLRPVDLNDVLRKMQGMLRRLIGEDIEIKMLLDEGLRKVQADPGQISQIIINLSANARDALPEGGRIVIQTSNWIVKDDLFHRQLGFTPGHYVRLMFSDNGRGMDPETAKHIFEPFFTTKEMGRGTGLGLSTVYGIVKQAAGQISVYSELGSGTTFSIYFPCSEAESCEPAAVEPKKLGGCETILLVEDEPSLRKLAESILQANGYEVLVASSGQDALARAEQRSGIQLMLTDIVMPGMDGQKLAREIMRRQPSIRPIFMSGYSEHAVLESILNDSAAAFLQKPFTPAQLLEKVREVLDAV
jgi:two-component system, cell cycle sensor histidine kinase and response regulator CckA